MTEINTATNQSHPNLNVIKAWSEGKTIQLKANNNWMDYRWNFQISPMSSDGLKYQWRIKPETITKWANIYDRKYEPIATLHDTVEEAIDEGPKPWKLIARIKITYEEGEGVNPQDNE